MIKRVHITALLLLVLCARSLLPAGFMVQAAHGSDRLFEVVICTSAGTTLVTLDDDGNPAAPAKSQSVDAGLCAFAAAGGAALVTEAVPSLDHQAIYSAATYTLVAALFAETPKPGATSARGPPSQLI